MLTAMSTFERVGSSRQRELLDLANMMLARCNGDEVAVVPLEADLMSRLAASALRWTSVARRAAASRATALLGQLLVIMRSSWKPQYEGLAAGLISKLNHCMLDHSNLACAAEAAAALCVDATAGSWPTGACHVDLSAILGSLSELYTKLNSTLDAYSSHDCLLDDMQHALDLVKAALADCKASDGGP